MFPSFKDFVRRNRYYLRQFAKNQTPLVRRYHRAQVWINRNTTDRGLPCGAGIRVTHRQALPYPEVTGYYIPTLLHWGRRDLAIRYGEWLLAIQSADGSWPEPGLKTPYTFDTGQILKGLLALEGHALLPKERLKNAILRGCDWILAQQEASGRIKTPDTSAWGLPGGRRVPEAIHLYCLSPIREAGKKWSIPKYETAVEKALQFYLADPNLTRFDTLSHFHAYILEALVDIGARDRAARALDELLKVWPTGPIPAYEDAGWICSTGLFQYAIIAWKLDRTEVGERFFEAACRLQNRSGGFFGGYGSGATYFPKAEISWAVKYFLDAFEWKIRRAFDRDAPHFPDSISPDDGRYKIIRDQIARTAPENVVDLGCGKGRFLKQLIGEFPKIRLTGMDVAEEMLRALPRSVEQKIGGLLALPFAGDSLEFAFCVEALEHAVDLPAAVAEMARVIRPGGHLVIIDKRYSKTGCGELSPWEVWPDERDLSRRLGKAGFSTEIIRNVSHSHGTGSDGLFFALIARKQAGGKAPHAPV